MNTRPLWWLCRECGWRTKCLVGHLNTPRPCPSHRTANIDLVTEDRLPTAEELFARARKMETLALLLHENAHLAELEDVHFPRRCRCGETFHDIINLAAHLAENHCFVKHGKPRRPDART